MRNYEEEYYDNTQLNYQKPSYRAGNQEIGCQFCWDNKTKKDIDIYFFDRANNMRLSIYCPYCGRNLSKEE